MKVIAPLFALKALQIGQQEIRDLSGQLDPESADAMIAAADHLRELAI